MTKKPGKGYGQYDETDTSSLSSSHNKSDYGATGGNGGTGAFIDHRQYNDLAHIHSSPARTRRRNSQVVGHQMAGGAGGAASGPFSYGRSPNDHLPLTNKNLHQFNSGSILPGTSRNKSIAIDMDQYAREQAQQDHHQVQDHEYPPFLKGRRRHRSDLDTAVHGTSFSGFGASFNGYGYDEDNFSVNSMEFGESNPSSEHSSDSTSLDDVCFPDYYAEAPEPSSAEWPDLKVLNEFIEMEQSGGRSEFENDYHKPEHHKPDHHHQHRHDSTAASEHVNFAPIKRVESNETASAVSKHSFQVTPTPIYPGDKSPQELVATAPILNKPRAKEDICRFTYFRDDLTKTIHSPTLSGLLLNSGNTKVKEQPTRLTRKWRDQNEQEEADDEEEEAMTVEDLFQPLYYSKKSSQNVSQSASQNASQNFGQNAGSVSGFATPSGVVSPGAGAGAGEMPLGATATAGAGVGTENETPAKTVVNRTLAGANTGPTSTGPGSTTGPTALSVADTTGTVSEPMPDLIPFWLDVFDPTEEEMKVLSKTFGIHPLTTEDIFLGEAREKVELFKSYYFICFTSFDVVYERRKQRIREQERKLNKLQELNEVNEDQANVFKKIFHKLSQKQESEHSYNGLSRGSSSHRSTGKKVREGELSPLSMYIIVFKHGVITFHFSPTPHPINVRRRIRLLKDYLTVSSDWVSYALIDDITDSFAPMIESIEEEVNSIEEAILRMHAGDNDSDSDEESESEDEHEDHHQGSHKKLTENIFFRRPRSKSVVDKNGYRLLDDHLSRSKTKSTSKSSSSKSYSKILGWKRKGDMLRRIGECRKRVMSVLRLLGSKADVIKGFSKRLNETDLSMSRKLGPQSKLEISMYLGDIQDHIVTMVQSLNHYEKLLARFHSNYLAQINIDMTKVNNDTNDVLGKITILGTIVLPINVVTGLWGMNCIVPGQDYEGLAWFWSIVGGMVAFSFFAYNYAKRAYGI